MGDNTITEAVPFDPTAYPEGVLLNIFANAIPDPSDNTKRKLFGKVGFQTLGPKTDKYVTMNLKSMEAAMNDGKVKDLEGNVVYNRGVVMLYGLLTRPTDDTETPQLAGFVDASSMTVVEIDQPVIATEEEEEIPF